MTPPDLSAFGALQVLRPLTGGARNAVWLVRGDGLFVAKSSTRPEPALRWLIPLQAAARAAGFTVPALIETPRGLAPGGWTLEPFVEGCAATAADLPALDRAVGAFHRLTATLPQRPGFRSARDLIHHDRGGDVDMTALPATVAALCRAAWSAPGGDETAIHGDLGPGNVILSPQGPALIDWDEARRDLPLFDRIATGAPAPADRRAHLAWEIACGWQREPDRARGLVSQLGPL